MRNMTANILLSRAATYVERYGLTKSELLDDTESERPRVCASGALIMSKYGRKGLGDVDFPEDSKFKNVIVKSAIRKIGKVLGKTSFTCDDLAQWNDETTTTKRKVINTFRRAIKVS